METSSIFFSIDTAPPIIESVSQIPSQENVQEDEVEITAIISDNVCQQPIVVLNYSINNGAWLTIPMTYSDEVYTTNIPACSFGTNVTYVIRAEDNAGNTISTEEMGYEYQYHVIPEFPSWISMPLFLIATLLPLAIRKISELLQASKYM